MNSTQLSLHCNAVDTTPPQTKRKKMKEDKGTVCVTGGTGYLGSWLVMRLLQHGYSVNTTVRSGRRDIRFLTNLQGASERLQIFNADLDNPETFDAAIDGCIGVFHVAHPVALNSREIDEKLNKKCIHGLFGILNACLRSKTVKRVVHTSSTATIQWNEGSEDAVLDENSWSDVKYIKELNCLGTSYIVSKIETEKAALEFAQNHGLELVSVIPSLIVGPFICPNIPISISVALSMIFGNEEIYAFLVQTSMIHIEDVVNAHIYIFECVDARGRYICSSHNVTIQGISQFLSERYPNIQIPSSSSLMDVKGNKQIGVSSKKLLDMGFEFMNGLDEMFDGAIQSSKEKGFL